ncbi:MAG: ABC transporter ATP-binding protein, partial [Prevotella sp.]|nr:ABC transporter ATP-binding protein [Prevotella sp.]
MKQFFQIMKRYLMPYKIYLVWSVILNLYAQLMNVFSFVVLIPILNILFQIDQKVYHYKEWTWSTLDKDLLVNNGYAYVQELMGQHGAFYTLCLMGAGLTIMTALKTLGYFASLSVMLPLRTGIVKDIRMEV